MSGYPLLCMPDRWASGTDLAFGSWLSGLDVENAAVDDFGVVARSEDATTASTILGRDLGAAYAIRGIAVVLPNATLAATVRVYGDSDSAFSPASYDSTALNVYPTTFFPAGSSYFGETVSGQMTQAEWDRGTRYAFIHVPAAVQSYRYWKIAIDDHTNSDNYVDVARVFMAGAYRPSVLWSSGLKFGYQRVTSERRTDGGSRYAVDSPAWRQFVASLDTIDDEDELMIQVLDISRRMGTSEDVLLVMDEDDTTHLQRRSFIGTLSYPDILSIAAPFWGGFPIQVDERI